MQSILTCVGILIFIVAFYFIITEKYPKSLVAIVSGGLMVIIGIMSEEQALMTVGYNLEILFLLIGMMIIVDIMSETGVFQWIAIKIAQVVKGDPVKILILISIVTALLSAFLDNVTTILLIVPVTIFLAKRLGLDPKTFVLLQIFMSNIGGTATMIGDPPNLIIASLGKISFNDFIINLAPVVLINIVVLLVSATFFLKKKLVVSRELRTNIMELDLSRTISDKKLLNKSVFVFGFVILGFLTNNITNIGLAVIAITGAILLMLISKKNPEEIFAKLEWETLFFFGGLFVLVQGIENLGIIKKVGEALIMLTKGNLELTSTVILIVSIVLSPIIGSIPHTLSFGKIILEILPTFQGDAHVLWWALSLGACLGGNMTIVGAAANIVGSSVAKKAGIEISFKEFFKWGTIIVLQSTVLSLIYLYIRY